MSEETKMVTVETEAAEWAGRLLVDKKLPAIVIADAEEALAIENELAEARRRKKAVKDYFNPMKKAAKAAHDAVLEREKRALDWILRVEERDAAALGQWATLQAAERARKIQEQHRSAMEDVRNAQAFGDAETAAEILRTTVENVAALEQRSASESAMTYREKKTWTVADLEKIPAVFLKTVVNEEAIDALVQSQGKKAEAMCPGILVEIVQIPVTKWGMA